MSPMRSVMKIVSLFSTLTLALSLSGCAGQAPLQPLAPTRSVLVQQPPQSFNQNLRTSISGLLGEEVELNGIYSPKRTGALLLLRSGEQLLLSDSGRVLTQLPGLESRTAVRIRGRVQTVSSGQLSLGVRQVVRV